MTLFQLLLSLICFNQSFLVLNTVSKYRKYIYILNSQLGEISIAINGTGFYPKDSNIPEH